MPCRARRIAEHSFVPDWLDSGSTVVDLGMNRGGFADAIHARFGCRVLGVEPDPELAAANAARGLACRHAAIAPEAGLVRFSVNPSDRTASRVTAADTPGAVEVEAITLGQLLAQAGGGRIALLKVDIEGAELAMFEREPPAVFDTVSQITVEFHAFLDPAQAPRVAAIRAAMSARGFFSTDFSICLMDVLFINQRHHELSLLDRQSLRTGKWLDGLRRRLRQAA